MICNKETTSQLRMCSLSDFPSQTQPRSRRKPGPGHPRSKNGSKRSRPTSNSKGFILSHTVTAHNLNAWIEHENPVNTKLASATEAAQIEEQKLQLYEREKRKRLSEFRQALLERLKENVEKCDTSDQRLDDALNIQHAELHRISPHQMRKSNGAFDNNSIDIDHQNQSKDALLVLSSEIEELSKGVREIMRNKMASDEAATLPGGLWYTSPTEDRDSIRHCEEFSVSLEKKKEMHCKDNNDGHQTEFPLSEMQPTMTHPCKKVTFADKVTVANLTPVRKPVTKTVVFQSAKPLNAMSESRKYYMDMERQKAREKVRMNQQREQIGRVKSQKEQERQTIEQQLKHCDFSRMLHHT